MNDFLTEKNKKAGVLGKLKWVLCGFCILLSLGAIGASEKYIGEERWGMAATEILLCLLFLYPTFRDKSMQKPQRIHFSFPNTPAFLFFSVKKSFMSVSSFSD